MPRAPVIVPPPRSHLLAQAHQTGDRNVHSACVRKHPAAVGHVRKIVHWFLVTHGFEEEDELYNDVVVVASELVTNALKNADKVVFTVLLAFNRVGLRVADNDPQFPVIQPPESGAENGRGLLIAHATGTLAFELQADGGKVVAWTSRELASSAKGRAAGWDSQVIPVLQW